MQTKPAGGGGRGGRLGASDRTAPLAAANLNSRALCVCVCVYGPYCWGRPTFPAAPPSPMEGQPSQTESISLLSPGSAHKTPLPAPQTDSGGGSLRFLFACGAFLTNGGQLFVFWRPGDLFLAQSLRLAARLDKSAHPVDCQTVRIVGLAWLLWKGRPSHCAGRLPGLRRLLSNPSKRMNKNKWQEATICGLPDEGHKVRRPEVEVAPRLASRQTRTASGRSLEEKHCVGEEKEVITQATFCLPGRWSQVAARR